VIRVVLVEPYYAGNIGSVARLAKNFEARELYLVAPHVSPLDPEALRWAVHAKDVLEGATVVNTLKQAIEGCSVVVATTGKPNEKSVARTPITPKQFARKYWRYVKSKERLAILFGREPSGLTNEEMQVADFTVTIPASPVYPILNLSHAVGIILYELYVHAYRKGHGSPPSRRSVETLFSFAERVVDMLDRDKPDVVKKILRASLLRGVRTEKEVNALIGVFADIWRRCGGAR